MLICLEPLRITFDKVDRFIMVYDETRYLVLFGSEKYDVIYNNIRYFMSAKVDIAAVFSHNYAIIKVESHDIFPLEKTLTLHIVTIPIKSVFNKIKITFTTICY